MFQRNYTRQAFYDRGCAFFSITNIWPNYSLEYYQEKRYSHLFNFCKALQLLEIIESQFICSSVFLFKVFRPKVFDQVWLQQKMHYQNIGTSLISWRDLIYRSTLQAFFIVTFLALMVHCCMILYIFLLL